MPTTYPPPTSFTLHRHLFALAWADARVTGDAERKSVTFRLRAKALDCIHPLKVCLGALVYEPPQGGKQGMGKRKVFRKGLLSGGEYFFWCA